MRFRLKILAGSLLIFAVVAGAYILYSSSDNKSIIKGEETASEVEEVNISDKTVAIDSGHGGIDPGKIGVGGIYEKNVNLAIAKKLKILLEQSGITVIMTRSDDNGLYNESDTNKKASDMKKRCSIINESNADAVVSIHQNSYVSGESRGAQVFYYKQSAEGKKLAGIIQRHIVNEADTTNKRVEKADSTYYLLLHTNVPAVIVECGFLSNPEEAGRLNSDSYQQKIAGSIYNALMEYLTNE